MVNVGHNCDISNIGSYSLTHLGSVVATQLPKRQARRNAYGGAMSRLLTDEEIDRQLVDLPDWTRVENSLVRTVQLATFPDAIHVVDKVAIDAESANHHPDIDIRWRTLTFRLSTHSAGGLTQRDVELAHQIDEHINDRG